MKNRVLALIIACVAAFSVFAVSACSKDDVYEEKKAKGNGDLVIATVTVYHEKKQNGEPVLTERLFFDSDNYLEVPEETNGAIFEGYIIKNGTQYFDENGKQDETLVIDKDITLLAHYEYEQCKIFFDADGGELTGDSSIDIEYMDEIPYSLPTATKAGKIFRGWRDVGHGLISDGDGKVLNNKRDFCGENYTINSLFKCTLVADYGEFTPTVTFDYNNSKYKNYTETVSYGGYVNIPEDVKDNGKKMIIGWYNQEEGQPDIDQLSMTYTKPITKDTTLVAVWDTYKEVELVFVNWNDPTQEIGFYYNGEYTNKITMKVFDNKYSPFPTAAYLNAIIGYTNYSTIEWYLDQELNPPKISGTPKNYSSYDTFYGGVY